MSELPQSWSSASVTELFSKIVDGSHNPPAAVAEGIPMLSARNIHDGRIEFAEFRYITPTDFRLEDARTRIRTDDILLTIVGTIGRSAVVTDSVVPMALQRSVAALTPRIGNPRFWMYQLQAPHIQREFIEKARGTAQKGVYLKTLGELRLRVAPIREQDRIVAEIEKQFTRLEDAQAALERVQANLKRYRASVLKAACEGRLVPTEAELARKEGCDYEPASELLKRILAERRAKWEDDQLQKMIAAGRPAKNDEWKQKYKEPDSPNTSRLPGLPEGWVWTTVEQISTKVVDGVHKKPSYVASGIPFVTVKNLTAGPGISFDNLNYITASDHEEFVKRANPESGDILVSKDGTLGVIRAIRTNQVFSIFVSVAMIKPVNYNITDYLEIALSSPQVQIQMVPKGSGLQHIHLEDLREDCIPLAPLKEQQRITEAANRHLSTIDALERELRARLLQSAGLRKALLKSAFEGKLIHQDPNDEPASVLLERIRAERATASTNRNGTQQITMFDGATKTQRRRRAKRLAQSVRAGKD